MTIDYSQITEAFGGSASSEQIQRMFNRYCFARQYCVGKTVLEVASGAGQGLGYLSGAAKFVAGGDYTEALVSQAKKHYGDRVPLFRLDAHKLPFRNGAFDVVILYEAIYYLSRPEEFAKEAVRVLKTGGLLLICLPNKSLPDFHRSPFSHYYYTPSELLALLSPFGFKVDFFGDVLVDYESPKSRLQMLLKMVASRFHLMPKSLKGREYLKRLIYGRLIPIPSEITEDLCKYRPLQRISLSTIPCPYRVIFGVAKLEEK